jgi:Trk K+ transport system NAD-binding subunit
VRFGFLYFSKRRNDKEWIAVQSQSMKDHVVLCGGGRVGYRVLGELQKLGMDVVVIERDEKAPFVPTMRRSGAPVLIDDVRDPGALKAVNIAHARAIVCATDDDLANLNLALDARKANPSIRVVIRLFDDDLVENARGALGFEALSTSSLAAPAFAMRAVDPSVLASFELNGRRIVVGEIVAGSWLTGKSPAQVRDETGALVLQASRGGEPFHDAQSGEVLAEGDRLVIQAVLEVYERLSGA